MKKYIVIFIFTIFTITAKDLHSQLQITPANNLTDIQNMINNIFVAGGVTVTNITFNGQNIGTGGSIPGNVMGSFTNGNTTNLGMNAGLIITTGNVLNVKKPASQQENVQVGSGSDPDLQSIATNTVYDAAVLEFDFVPLDTFIRFRYIFASEEYPEYVCSNYNDVFGFFISGPNPAGGNYVKHNIALIPGTTMAVAINSVNGGSVGANGNISNCQPPKGSLSYSMYYTNNAGGQYIVYDGFTKPLEAYAKVVPCATYHLKIAIGDVGDRIYDSGVFLEANSFQSSGVVGSVTYSTENPDSSYTYAIEGCTQATLTFSGTQPFQQPFVIPLQYFGIPNDGSQFPTLPNQLVIPAGQTSASITISPYMDGILEGTMTLGIVAGVTTCGQDTIYVEIRDNFGLNAHISSDTAICGTQQVHLTAIPQGGRGPYTYSWSHNLGSLSTIHPIVSTTTVYTVTITDKCGYSATDQVTIISNPLPNITVTHSNQSLCLGQTDNITASGADVYQWSAPITPSTGQYVSVTPTTTSTYTVTGTNLSTGCSNTTTFTVTVNPLPTVILQPTDTLICLGESVTITASGASTYTWSPNTNITQSSPNTFVFNPTSAGIYTYTVTGTSTAGCTDTENLNIVVRNNPTVTVFPDYTQVCVNSSVPIIAQGANGYTWAPTNIVSPAVGPQVMVSSSVVQTVTLTVTGLDPYGCSGTATAVVEFIPQPNLSIQHTQQVICLNQSNTMTAYGATDYVWSCSQTSCLSNTTGNTVVATPTSSVTITLIGTDNNTGCSDTITTTITVNPLPNIITSPFDTTICLGQNTAIHASGGISYTWAPPTYLNQTTGQIVISSPTSPGDITYTVTGTDANGCTNTATTIVHVSPGPTIVINPNPAVVCDGGNITLTASGAESYVWSAPPGTLNSTTGSSVTTTNLSSSIVVTVTGTDALGCKGTTTVNVNVGSLPVFHVEADPPSVCQGTSTTIFVTNTAGNYSYTWSPSTYLNTTTGSTVVSTPTTQITYFVTATDAAGCMSTDSITIFLSPNAQVNFTADKKSGCAPLTVQFYNNSPDVQTLTWQFNDPPNSTSTVNNPVHTFNNPGTYTISLTATNHYGCTGTFTYPNMITVHPIPDADFIVNPEVGQAGSPFTFTSTSTANGQPVYNTLSWNFGDNTTGTGQTVEHTYYAIGEYTVWLYVVTPEGCRDSVSKTIRVVEIDIPNVITANSDGFNDRFIIPNIELLENSHLLVYNRWGRLMYESFNYKNDWYPDPSVSDGVYYWILYLNNGNSYCGNLTILRSSKK